MYYSEACETFRNIIMKRTVQTIFLLVNAFFFVLMPLGAQNVQNVGNQTLEQRLKAAEDAFKNRRPDYLLTRDLYREIEAGNDLEYKMRITRLQAKMDSAGRRMTSALPNFQKSYAYEKQLIALEKAKDADVAKVEIAKVVDSRDSALSKLDATIQELESEKTASSWKLTSALGAALALLGLGAFGFFVTTRKLKSDADKAKDELFETKERFRKVVKIADESSYNNVLTLRKIVETNSLRFGVGDVGSPANQLAAQNEALAAVIQSKLGNNGNYEVAMEAVFEKLNSRIQSLLKIGDSRLKVESMPIRLSMDYAVPIAFIFNELVGNAFKHNPEAREVKVVFTKEGDHHTFTFQNDGTPFDLNEVKSNGGLKLVNFLVDQIGGKLLSDDQKISIKFINHRSKK